MLESSAVGKLLAAKMKDVVPHLVEPLERAIAIQDENMAEMVHFFADSMLNERPCAIITKSSSPDNRQHILLLTDAMQDRLLTVGFAAQIKDDLARIGLIKYATRAFLDDRRIEYFDPKTLITIPTSELEDKHDIDLALDVKGTEKRIDLFKSLHEMLPMIRKIGGTPTLEEIRAVISGV